MGFLNKQISRKMNKQTNKTLPVVLPVVVDLLVMIWYFHVRQMKKKKKRNIMKDVNMVQNFK